MKAEGEFAQVAEYLKGGMSTASGLLEIGDNDLITMLTDMAAEQDNLEYLNEFAPQAEDLAKQLDHRLYKAIAARAMGVKYRLDKEYKQAENRLTKAMEIFEESETAWQLGRTHYEFGQLYAAQDQPKEAKKHYEQAIARYESLGARPNIERTQAALKAMKN